MDLLARYWKEREDRETIHDEFGFATYCYPNETDCYIVDIYVLPEARHLGKARGYADKIAEIAKKRGCSRLIGSVDLTTNGSAESMKVLLAYGMRPLRNSDQMTYFWKET